MLAAITGLLACEPELPPDRPLTAVTPTAAPDRAQCPRVRPGGSVGRIEYAELVETSGLVASQRHPGLLWAHNDSGNAAVLFALGSDGSVRARLSLPESVTATDWEDIARLPGREGRPDRLVLADIGDNARTRERVQFVLVDEPDPTAGDALVPTSTVEVVDAAYPDGPHNAEALLVDARAGALLVVTKRKEGGAALYRLALAERVAGSVQTLEPVGELPLVPTLPGSATITGGDANERIAVLRGYSAVWLWPWPPEVDRLDVLLTTRPPCPGLVGIETQGEAIALLGEDRYVTTSEGERPALLSFELGSGATSP